MDLRLISFLRKPQSWPWTPWKRPACIMEDELGLMTYRAEKINLSSQTKIESRWVKNINIRTETMNLPGKKVDKILEDISIGKDP